MTTQSFGRSLKTDYSEVKRRTTEFHVRSHEERVMAPHLALGSSPLSRRLASRVSFKQNSWTKGRRENGQQVHFYLLADVIGINDDALTTFLWMIKDHFISSYQALKNCANMLENDFKKGLICIS